MHRWWGSKEESDKQTAERSQRAAKRYIRNSVTNVINALSDEDEFQDCDTSFQDTSLFDYQVDGENDPDESADIMPDQWAAEKAKPFAESNYPDDDEAWKRDLKN